MYSSTFFRLFPPPKFLVMKYAGLDISDDAIHCLEYGRSGGHLSINKFASLPVPEGLFDGGDIKDDRKLGELLTELDTKIDLSYVKVSISEEKAYLFQTDVPNEDITSIRQNIEFKLEENVPLSAADAVFYFDLLPLSATGGTLRASVSVVPRTYIERYIALLSASGVAPVAFEIVPKAIARAIVSPHREETMLILHVMSKKTGIYIVSSGVVSFTSTLAWGNATPGTDDHANYAAAVSKEVARTYAYWSSHSGSAAPISRIVLAGRDASLYEGALQNAIPGVAISVHVADVWRNAFNLDQYVPPIAKAESLEYAVAAGLALPS